MSNPDQLLAELRKRVANEEPLPGETYFRDDETLLRFLKAREWNLDAAEKQLREAIAWRRSYKPLTADCRWCHEQPGCHSMRQVGFDESGRPVIYSCFAQADASRNNVEDSIAHCTYLIENAKRTMRPGVTTWIFVIDCTGLSLPLCNPSLAKGVVNVFSSYYPEQMARIVCVNHSPLFHGVWNAIKLFLDAKTAKKMKFIRGGKSKMRRKFDELFGESTAAWLLEEIRLNRQDPTPESQVRFWEAPMRPGQHDPRGCRNYVEQYVDPYFVRLTKAPPEATEAATAAAAGLSRPHPNIADELAGRSAARQLQLRQQHRLGAGGGGGVAATAEDLAAYGLAGVPASADSEDSNEDDD